MSDGRGIYARRFAADGTALADEIQVNTHITGSQRNPSVSLDADGDLVVAWESFGEDGDLNGIRARPFAADGTTRGPENQVNTHTTGNQRNPSVSLDADGDFVVAWQSFGQDGDSYGIYARPFLGRGCYGNPLEAAIAWTASPTAPSPLTR